MMNFWLLQALGDVDPDLVERAAQPPRKVHPLRWMAAVAAVVMVVCVGIRWYNPPKTTPPITDLDTPIGQTGTSTTTTTVPTTTTTEPNGTGGDEWGCDAHNGWYHTFDGNLIEYVGVDRFRAWSDGRTRLPADRTYPYHDCPYPDSNIIAFVEYFDITRDQFVAIMGWGEVLDQFFADSIYLLDEQSRYLYTFGDFVEAIYGDDPHLTAWVFDINASSRGNYSVAWTCQYYYAPPHDRIYPDPIYTYEGDYSYEQYCTDAGVNANIVDYVALAGISREQFIDIYGWGDKLDEKATDHFAYAPYTYRQFVDAVYGDDEALRDWVFDRYVFSPGYPTAP